MRAWLASSGIRVVQTPRTELQADLRVVLGMVIREAAEELEHVEERGADLNRSGPLELGAVVVEAPPEGFEALALEMAPRDDVDTLFVEKWESGLDERRHDLARFGDRRIEEQRPVSEATNTEFRVSCQRFETPSDE